ncbi:hypothetical protein EXIGLDRAFT_844188 [Exidia glandulosa HHB12029]|uniref:N-acetyltransferase domain-containing protein n=1 Tax=Exidia glandulosa HHB12029 TaxID=1314781 RepID=A0A165C6M2_EXIGL|nr:hypothetical protein EXIGLDRAFT_844188 [Exidia glandulosa HHB12029]
MTMTPTVRVVKTLSDSARKRVVDVLAAAYDNEIVLVNAFAGDRTKIRPFVAACAMLSEAAGGLHVLGLTDDRIDAVALWFPPGHELEPTAESGWFDVLDKLARDDPDVHEWWGPLLKSQNDIVEALYGSQADRDSWFLWCIAVDPSLQRQSLGSQLMQHVIAEANKSQTMILVEGAKAGAGFYEKNGLVQVGQVTAESPRGPSWEQVVMAYVPEHA